MSSGVGFCLLQKMEVWKVPNKGIVEGCRNGLVQNHEDIKKVSGGVVLNNRKYC